LVIAIGDSPYYAQQPKTSRTDRCGFIRFMERLHHWNRSIRTVCDHWEYRRTLGFLWGLRDFNISSGQYSWGKVCVLVEESEILHDIILAANRVVACPSISSAIVQVDIGWSQAQ
jgi:hypothetical protein